MRRKNLHLIVLSILLLGSSMLFAWDGFNYVIANESNAGIRVDWQVKDEHNVHYYEIYRSRKDSNIMDKRASVSAIGGGASYTYQDDDLFSKSASSGDYRFDYFVRAVMKDGSYWNSDKIEVAVTTLGVSQQTWGSIKAMFR